jgi:hypothetical protein
MLKVARVYRRRRMSKDTKNTGDKLSVSSTKTLTLKRGGVEQGVVRHSLSHGRSRAVVVEKVKRSIGPNEAKAEPVAVAPALPPKARGVVLRTLTPEERGARQQVAEAHRREMEGLNRHEAQTAEEERIAQQDKRQEALRAEFSAHRDEFADNEEARHRIENAVTNNAAGLYLGGLGALRLIPDLRSSLPNLVGLSLAWTRISDVTALSRLSKLKYLNLCGTSVRHLSPLANLPELETLILWGTPVDDISPLQTLRNLRILDLEATHVSNLQPLSNLLQLASLDLRKTEIVDIAPLSKLTSLAGLRISDTRVSDISTALAMHRLTQGASLDPLFGGLSFVGCPIENPELIEASRDPNPRRTGEVFTLLREIRDSADESDGEEGGEVEQKSNDLEEAKPVDLEPIENVPSPFAFQLSLRGTIAVTSSPANIPSLPLRTSERAHEKRLDVCRTLAEDLISDTDKQAFQIRGEYRSGMQKYAARLPSQIGDGNILLADAEARTLRTLFAAEADFLPVAFTSKLKTFLEHHMGLRVFYPEIASFYHDVQTGHIEAPLPLDAVEGVVQGVLAYTPKVFEASVSEALETSTEELPSLGFVSQADRPPHDSNQPMPPKDPLGEVDSQKARDFTIAGVVNNLWKAFRTGEKFHKALDGWIQVGEILRPHVKIILEWLHSAGGGGPPLPPTFGV